MMKPRIIVLLLFTALGGMFLAAEGAPGVTLTIAVLGAGALASGGANALNQWLERDLDGQMTRTQNRPLVSGRVSPSQALIFGTALNGVAFFLLSTYVNTLSAVLTLSATLFYILVYTMGLKRTTPHNIVIGGAAGAIPPMVGWAAVTGTLELPALYLFAIIFFWTPPHFWALSLLLKDDYARAKIPMLPVVAGVDQTKNAIFLYTLLTVALTTMLFSTGAVGWIYLVTSSVMGVVFIYYAWLAMRTPGTQPARGLFLYSMFYLASLFMAVIVDSTLAV